MPRISFMSELNLPISRDVFLLYVLMVSGIESFHTAFVVSAIICPYEQTDESKNIMVEKKVFIDTNYNLRLSKDLWGRNRKGHHLWDLKTTSVF